MNTMRELDQSEMKQVEGGLSGPNFLAEAFAQLIAFFKALFQSFGN